MGTEINRQKVRELYEQGYGYQKISRELACSEWAVRKYINDSGIKTMHFTQCTDELVEQIRRLYLDEGKKIREVSEITGISFSKIKSILVRKGITRTKCPQKGRRDDSFSKIKINKIDDPIFYLEHEPTNEKVSYNNKQYRDVSAMILGG